MLSKYSLCWCAAKKLLTHSLTHSLCLATLPLMYIQKYGEMGDSGCFNVVLTRNRLGFVREKELEMRCSYCSWL